MDTPRRPSRWRAAPVRRPARPARRAEIKLAMAALLRHFDIVSVDTPDGQAPREHLQLSMGPVGLAMRLRARGA